MPEKYHVKIRPLPPRHAPVSRYNSIEFDGCLGCLKCVKRDSCIYEVYKKREFLPDELVDTGDGMCLNCFRCIQECKKNIISRAVNPRFLAMGDDYWTPDLIAGIWKQAYNGKIPVSGAGYRGPFSGPGFDSMWTDMSEIVRPTRDGIHGREYISTVIELGRKPEYLKFDKSGAVTGEMPSFIRIPLPIILDIPERGVMGSSTRRAMARAARELGTLAVADPVEARGELGEYAEQLMVRLKPGEMDAFPCGKFRAVELAWGDKVIERAGSVKSSCPGTLVSVSLPLDESSVSRATGLAAGEVDVIHLRAGPKGRGFGRRSGDFVTDLVREVHLGLVERSLREQVSVLVSGGIALAEHVAKTIICGADGVGVDTALLVALECRLCSVCAGECPVGMDEVPVEWAAQRMVNLVGSWHSQLLEVLGAMGLREVRRLRGEIGRAMFFRGLEEESFGPLFDERDESSVPRKGNGEVESAIARSGSERLPEPVSPSPSRFRNPLSRYRVVRSVDCVACGECARVCGRGVHKVGGEKMLAPKSHLCVGPETCKARGAYCADACPRGAVRVGRNPMYETFGDPRWTNDLLVSTWHQAETGRPPEGDIEYKVGASGGGFDMMDFEFPPEPADPGIRPEEIDLSLPLNRLGDGRPEVRIGIPMYGGGMSFGSIGLATMISRARAWRAFGSLVCTGEGGYPDALTEYDDNVITQVATGLFGVREETIQRVPVVEFKYAQGAKPGLGGHLLGDKVTAAVARMREAVEGSALFSPFPFHSVYSVEDHKKHVDWIKVLTPRALVSVKVSTPTDVDMVAVGSYYAGAHIVHLDGSYGGTGAAPDIAKKNIAMPIEYAVPKVHRFLVEEGIRDKVTLIASGGLRTAWDVAKAIALGADGVVIGTAELVALECIRCGNCESGRGCPRGIATTDPELSAMYDTDWGAQRIINMLYSWVVQLRGILWWFGMRSVAELVGRSDLLVHRQYARRSA